MAGCVKAMKSPSHPTIDERTDMSLNNQLTVDYPLLMRQAQASAAVTQACSCTITPLQTWTAQPLTLELDCFEAVGTLLDDPYDEPTFAEYHPAGTRYDSPDAPIAPRFYPTTRCSVARCTTCSRHYLR